MPDVAARPDLVHRFKPPFLEVYGRKQHGLLLWLSIKRAGTGRCRPDSLNHSRQFCWAGYRRNLQWTVVNSTQSRIPANLEWRWVMRSLALAVALLVFYCLCRSRPIKCQYLACSSGRSHNPGWDKAFASPDARPSDRALRRGGWC